MNKYKYLGKNIGLLTLSSFGTKLLSFFLVPLYTHLLSTTDYGIYDIFSTTISLAIPILTVNIHDGVLRFLLDKDEKDSKGIFTAGLRLVVGSSILVAWATLVIAKFELISVIAKYPVYFVAMYVSVAFYQLLSNYARGVECIKDVSISGVISAVTGILLNIVLLAYCRIGLDGYFIATIMASIVPSIYLWFKLDIKAQIYFGRIDTELRRKMLVYSAPLVLNAIGWWVNSASDRYVVTALCGIAANGIYAVGYKIPSILNVFQTIFNQAWVLSSVKEYDPDDSDGFFRSTYSVYNALMVIVCAFIIGANKILAKYLYLNSFYEAWIYVPYLTIAIVFGALSGLIGGVFSAAKASRIFGISTMIGAIVNLALNILLVYLMGPMGAAISTAVSYCLVWVIRLVYVRRFMRVKISLMRDVLSYCMLVLLGLVVQFAYGGVTGAMLIIGIILFVGVLYFREIGTVLNILKGFRKKQND